MTSTLKDPQKAHLLGRWLFSAGRGQIYYERTGRRLRWYTEIRGQRPRFLFQYFGFLQ